MKYEKPMVEVVKFENQEFFLTNSGSVQRCYFYGILISFISGTPYTCYGVSPTTYSQNLQAWMYECDKVTPKGDPSDLACQSFTPCYDIVL